MYEEEETAIIDQTTAATIVRADAICGDRTVGVKEWDCSKNGAKQSTVEAYNGYLKKISAGYRRLIYFF